MSCSDCVTYCCSQAKTEVPSAGEATGRWYGRLGGSQVSLAAWSRELVATLDVGGDRGGLLATLSFVNVGSVLGLVLGFLAGAASTGAGANVLTLWMRGGITVLIPREVLRLASVSRISLIFRSTKSVLHSCVLDAGAGLLVCRVRVSWTGL